MGEMTAQRVQMQGAGNCCCWLVGVLDRDATRARSAGECPVSVATRSGRPHGRGYVKSHENLFVRRRPPFAAV